jgi:hypothetical protein
MAKPMKLPRKLREKLAEIAAKRDAREAHADELDVPPYRTFYQAFLGKGTVHTMYAHLDQVHRRMETRYILEPPITPRRIFVRPPWEDEPRDAAE